jgi:DNA-binding transcriptional MerR regulator
VTRLVRGLDLALQDIEILTYTACNARTAEVRASAPGLAMATQPLGKHEIEAPSIPDRLYFEIGDVARICGVETYVLRFWETQFPQLKPNKSGTGQRLYRRRDVETAFEIKRLVHDDGYTLAGARQALGVVHGGRNSQGSLPLRGSARGGRRDAVAAAVGQARAELREIAALLAAPVARTQRRTRIAAMQSSSGALFSS